MHALSIDRLQQYRARTAAPIKLGKNQRWYVQ